jgi:hypothetical protein
MGKQVTIPPEIHDDMAEYTPPVVIPHNTSNHDHKVVFAVAHKP